MPPRSARDSGRPQLLRAIELMKKGNTQKDSSRWIARLADGALIAACADACILLATATPGGRRCMRIRNPRAPQGSAQSSARTIDPEPGEIHLLKIRQLTFGGENAEAYWSADGTGDLPVDSRRPLCDQQLSWMRTAAMCGESPRKLQDTAATSSIAIAGSSSHDPSRRQRMSAASGLLPRLVWRLEPSRLHSECARRGFRRLTN